MNHTQSQETKIQVDQLLKHLEAGNSIEWLEALKKFKCGGGFRARCSDIRKILAERNNGVTLISVKVPKKKHHIYYLSTFRHKFEATKTKAA